jgi:hypothetical protein
MSISSSEALGPPAFDDFDAIREQFLLISQERDAHTREVNSGFGLWIKLERIYADMDSETWPPLTLCLFGVLHAHQSGHKLAISYREMAKGHGTADYALIHNYAFATSERKLVEFAHTIKANPELTSPVQELGTDQFMNEQQQGAKILKSATGKGLEPTAGDCGVLYDRMLMLLGPEI